MVYEVYVKRGGKRFGPYRYESYRDKTGKVRTRYVGGAVNKQVFNWSLFLIIVFFIGVISFVSYFDFSILGAVIDGGSVSDDGSSSSSNVLDSSGVSAPSSDSASSSITPSVVDSPNLSPEQSSSSSTISSSVSDSPSDSSSENPVDVSNSSYSNQNNSLEVSTITNSVSENQSISSDSNDSGKSFQNSSNESISANFSVVSNSTNLTFINNTLDGILLNNTTNDSISNQTILNATTINLINNSVIQYSAVIGKPVKWQKKIKISGDIVVGNAGVVVTVPSIAENISVAKVDAQTNDTTDLTSNVRTSDESKLASISFSSSITGNAIYGNLNQKSGKITSFFSNISSAISKLFRFTGLAIDTNSIVVAENTTLIINGDVAQNDSVVVDYYTPAPYVDEKNLSEFSKEITVVGPDEVHYTNILSYSDLPYAVSVDKILLYWINETSGEKQKVDFQIQDTDSNGLVNSIQWVVPHLSNQTYEIILITNALHLDSSREFISDIYDLVKAQDNNWTENIPSGDYVRAVYERNLTSSNDITIYARNLTANASVEIYTKDGTELISTINVTGEGLYKTYLTSLVNTTDTFDLKSIGDIEYDYITDPITYTYVNGTGVNITVVVFGGTGNSSWTVPNGVTSVEYLIVGGGGGGGGNRAGGGGGAGAVNRGTTNVSAGSSINITVGAGGSAGLGNPDQTAGNGGNSSFDNLTAPGGGGGGLYPNNWGIAGGCGGGGAPANGGSGGAINVTPQEGYTGGTGSSSSSSDNGAGGGGGAGGAGGNGGTGVQGAQGAGINSSINGTNVTYATGGLGGYRNAGTSINAGTNTGNGGQGSVGGTSGSDGLAGGSGVVIISYVTPPLVPYTYINGSGVNISVVRFGGTGNSSWTVPNGVTSVEYLIVGGGGGGSRTAAAPAAGGGAGGVINGTTNVTAGTNYTIEIGAGGGGRTTSGGDGGQGSDTTVFGLTAGGGGGGNFGSISSANNGGATNGNGGGGGGATTVSPGNGAGAGYSGGFSAGLADGNGGGGGGGAGEVGYNGTSTKGGNGGNGTLSNITGTATYYGGGGGGDDNDARGIGGSGGGGNARVAGTANTGGGGGGGVNNNGGNGGSGAVIISYVTPTGEADTTYPQFSNYQDNNGTLLDNGTGQFNVTVLNTNGTVWLNINGENITATNATYGDGIYNATYDFTTGGVYNYQWFAYGNGTNKNLNVSATRNYVVNATPDTTPPYFTTIPANQSVNYGTGLGVQFNATDDTGFGTYYLGNWTDKFSVNSTGYLVNTTSIGVGEYIINVSINDTAGNTNMTWYNLTVNQANTALNITGTTPITYGTITDVVGGNCPSGLTCTLTPSNAIFGVGTQLFNYSTSGNANYTSNWSVINITINQANNSLNLSSTAGFSYVYGNSTTLSCAGNGTANLFINGTSITNPLTATLGVGSYNVSCNTTGNTNYTANSTYNILTISKASSAVNLTATTPITYGTTTDFAGGNCPDGSCSLNITNQIFGVGNVTANYSFLGNANYTSSSAIFAVQINPSSDSCSVLFNTTSPITYPTTFRVWSNCTTAFTLLRNGSIISNNSVQSLAVGSYNFTAIRNDSFNYTNYVNEKDMVVSSDSVYPQFSNYQDNTASLSGSGIGLFNVTLLNTNGTVWLNINNTNVTATNINTSAPSTSPTDNGSDIGYPGGFTSCHYYKIWACNIAPDSTKVCSSVYYNNNSGNGWGDQDGIHVSLAWTAVEGAETYVVEWKQQDSPDIITYRDVGNVTSYEAGSMTEISGVFTPTYTAYGENVYNVSYNFTNSGSYNYQWFAYGNGSSNNLNVSATRNYVVNAISVDNSPSVTLSYPSASYVNSTSQYVNLTFNASVSDDNNLVNCSLWTNSTGTWQLNQTQTIIGTSNVTNFSLNNLNNKTFIWNIKCFDNASQSAFGTANRSVILNYTIPDTTYPQFSNSLQNVTNNTAYSFGRFYNFSVNILNTNGTAGINFNGVNYSLTNVSNNFNYILGGLGAGTYNFSYWAYGNGSSNLFNLTSNSFYIVALGNSTLGMILSTTTPITYGTNSSFVASEMDNGDGGCSYSLNDSNKIFGVGIVWMNYSTTGCANYSSGWVINSTTINQATPALNITGTTSITYGTVTSVVGGNCSSGLTCTLTPSNGIFSVGIQLFNYSTSGNVNYTANWSSINITINQSTDSCSVLFNTTSPISYGTTFLVWSNCTSAFTLYRNGSIISNNSVQSLAVGSYNFTAIRNDSFNYTNYVNEKDMVVSSDSVYPQFSNYQDNNASLSGSGIGLFNVTVLNTNGTVWLEINNTNVTATNISANVYNVSYNFTNSGVYNYQWFAYGNGSSNNLNVSATRNYVVNVSADTTYPQFSNNLTSIANGSQYNLSNSYAFNITILNTNGTTGISFNGVNYTLTNLSNNFTKIFSTLGTGTYSYYFWAYGNGTSKNFNSSSVQSYTINQATPALNITGTSPITYGTITNVFGGNCPSGLTCTLTPSNAIFSAGIQLFNYSTNGNTNYTSNWSVVNITINQANNSLNLSSSAGFSYVYGNSTTLSCAGNGTANLFINGTSITNPLTATLGVGSYNVSCNTTGNTNYTANSTYNILTISKATDSCSVLFNTTSPITYPTTFRVWSNCTTAFTLLRNGTSISNNSVQSLGAGDYNFTVIRTDTQNYSNIVNELDMHIDKATPSLGLTATTPITYGTISNFAGSGCPDGSCSLNVTNQIFGAGNVTANYSFLGNANYSSASALFTIQINQATSQTSLTFDKTSPQTYGTAITPTCSIITGGSEALSLTNGTSGVSETLGANNWLFNCSYAGNQNYTASSNSSYFLITQASSTGTLLLNGTAGNIVMVYPNQVNASFTNSTTATLLINGTDITSNNNLYNNISGGYWNFTLLISGNQNYSATTITRFATINKASSAVNLTLNNSQSNISIYAGNSINLNCSTLSGDSSGRLSLFKNGTLINSGNSPLGNLTTFGLVGLYNITCYYNASTNYSDFSATYYVNVTLSPDTTYPQFSNYIDNNATLTDSGIGRFNVTVTNTNGTVWLNINNTNVTATNISANVYNVSYNFVSYGDYSYRWYAFGNGSSKNLNNSVTRNYVVNNSDLTYPQFSNYQDNNATLVDSGTGYFNVTLLNINGTVILNINNMNVTATNSTYGGNIYNATYSFVSGGSYNYQWYSYGNGTTHNFNVSVTRNYFVNATPINGSCGTTNNNCISGILNNIADNSTDYLWQCLGQNGGTSANCNLIIPSVPSENSGGSGGGGGGGVVPVIPVVQKSEIIQVDSTPHNLNLVVGARSVDQIVITNKNNGVVSFRINISNSEGIFRPFESVVTLGAGETRVLKFNVVAPGQPGIYTGKIIISEFNGKSVEVPFVLNVNSEKSLFDVNLDIPVEFKIKQVGGNLSSQITLIQMGKKEKEDVTTTYLIKDFDGNVYLKESETLMVYNQKSYTHQISLVGIPPGKYVLGIEVLYLGGVATSSSAFSIQPSVVNSTNFPLIVLAVAIIFILIIFISVIKRYKKEIEHSKRILYATKRKKR